MLLPKIRDSRLNSKHNLLSNKKRRASYLKHHLIYIPSGFNFLLLKGLKNAWIMIYNNTYQVTCPVPSMYMRPLSSYNSRIIDLNSLTTNTYHKTYVSLLNQVVSSFFKPYFNKIKFRGKGYYIYKNTRNTIAPQFGYSHRVYIYSYFNKIKFIGKTKVILFGLVKEDILTPSLTLKAKRPINIFTGRGVRFARQIVYKKQGKVSSYR